MRSLPYSRIFWPMAVLLVPFVLLMLAVSAALSAVEALFLRKEET